MSFGDFFSGEQGIKSVSQIVLGRFHAAFSVVRPLIVDSASVYEVSHAVEDGGLWSDFRFALFDELVFSINDDGRLQRIFCCVFFCIACRELGVDMDEGEFNSL